MTANLRLDPPHFAISAALSGEEDFELGGEFLDVFVRAGERVAGFLAGCMLIAGVWFLCAALLAHVPRRRIRIASRR